MKPECLSRLRAPLFAAACGLLLLGGCASVPANPDDPLEGYNRAMFRFNEGVDKAVLKPVAQAYDAVTPDPVQTGVGNFLGNLADPWIGLNNLLQGKPAAALSDWMRFLFNSTWGLAGLLDIASPAGLAKHDEDFGQTLAVWGVGEGAYVVLPLFGSRTLRDAAALPADMRGDRVWRAAHVPTRNSVSALSLVHNRAMLLPAERALEESALDKYAYMRDFYLQQRRYKVNDGRLSVDYEDFDARRKPAGATAMGGPGTDGGPLARAPEGAGHRGMPHNPYE